VCYLGASAFGWWFWSRSEPRARTVFDLGFSPTRAMVTWILVTAVISVALGSTMARVHEFAPALFPEPASFPFLDALTTVMSLVAMWWMARKRMESWIYWLVVDVIAIWLYTVKYVRFVALLDVVLTLIAARGLASWAAFARGRRPMPGWRAATTRDG
jgi:nicotinamide mononucleotide transporter